jgi:hypothetical protein
MSIGWTLGPADVLWIWVVVLPILVGLGSYAVTIAALASAIR